MTHLMRPSNDHGGNDVLGEGGGESAGTRFVRSRRNPYEEFPAGEKNVGAICRQKDGEGTRKGKRGGEEGFSD